MSDEGWIGVDLDGTMAHYEGWNGGRIGLPVPEMIDRVKRLIDKGYEVRVFTARAYRWEMLKVSQEHGAVQYGWDNYKPHNVLPERVQQAWDEDLKHVSEWVVKHVGMDLKITCIKDYRMIELYDDRARQVEPNTGRLLEDLVPCPLSIDSVEVIE